MKTNFICGIIFVIALILILNGCLLFKEKYLIEGYIRLRESGYCFSDFFFTPKLYGVDSNVTINGIELWEYHSDFYIETEGNPAFVFSSGDVLSVEIRIEDTIITESVLIPHIPNIIQPIATTYDSNEPITIIWDPIIPEPDKYQIYIEGCYFLIPGSETSYTIAPNTFPPGTSSISYDIAAVNDYSLSTSISKSDSYIRTFDISNSEEFNVSRNVRLPTTKK